MGGRDRGPKKDLPAWTKQKPDKVSVNPPADSNKGGSFKHTAPTPQNNFAKTNMPVGNLGAVFSINSKKRKNIQ